VKTVEAESIITLLRREMRPALGVTEPGAIALACARAYRCVGGELRRIALELDGGIYKNCFACAIPGTAETGITMAALLGALIGDPALELEVLRPVTPEAVARANRLREQGVVEITVRRDHPAIYIAATVETNRGTARVIIRDKHANIVRVEANGVVLVDSGTSAGSGVPGLSVQGMTLADMYDFIAAGPEPSLAFVLAAVEMNRELAKAGEAGPGIGLGAALSGLEADGSGLAAAARRLTGLALDARVGGVGLPAMSIAGSGAHGIIATLPLAAAAEHLGIPREQLARAVALSFLTTLYIKEYSGLLSAYCGCAIAAGTGASAGLTFLLGGSAGQIGAAISNMAANITGMICDGGNYGCSLKAVTAAGAAVLAAQLAVRGIAIPAGSGIVGKTPEATMQNMGRIAAPGMLATENTILDIMSAPS